jgi:hypothetical protein
MTFGWTENTHQQITQAALNYLNFSIPEKHEILQGEAIPDTELPWNALNHFQTPNAGRSIRNIVDNFNKNNLLSLGKAVHYLQDLTNPFHTSFSYQDLHQEYENYAETVPFDFIPGKHVLTNDLERSLNRLAFEVRGYLHEIRDSRLNNDRAYLYDRTVYLKKLATQATYDLIRMWMK